jgi:radical SAM superfamily enzyme YgiQ (UPF0313 family)
VTPAPAGRASALDAPGAILLLSCYELGHAPLGLASPAAWLESAGFRPAVHDLAAGRLEPEAVRQARFVGISVPMHTALRLGLQVARRVRELTPAAHVCAYGLYAGLNASLLLEGPADSVIGGEYEPPLLALVQALAQGSPPRVPGVSTRAHREPPRLARTPFLPPARHGLRPLQDYARLELPGGTRTVGYVEASRGCKHLCRHCPIPPAYGGRFFVVPRDVLLADIAGLVAQGAEHITFGDPDFFNGPGHALALVRALHARFPAVTYDATIKVEHLLKHRPALPELARTGCLFVVSAVESLSDTVLAHLRKGHTRADVSAALAAMREAGIAMRPTWVPFTPWATLEDYRELLAFVWREGLVRHVDSVQFAIRLLVPPGSALLDTEAFAPYQGELDPEALTVRWAHPDPRMDALQQAVAGIVEAAATEGSPAEDTFGRIQEAAWKAAGDAVTPRFALEQGVVTHPPAPRLTEPWFC